MTGTTNGEACYWGYVGDDTAPMWEVLDDHTRRRWERAAHAAIGQDVAAAKPVPVLAALRALVADILQSLPDTADEQEWRDRAGTLGVTDPDGQPYRAWTEDECE